MAEDMLEFLQEIQAEQEAYATRTQSTQGRLKELINKLRAENRQLRDENTSLKSGKAYYAARAKPSHNQAAPAGMEELQQTYKQSKIIRSHDAPVHSVAMSNQGILAAASWDATVSLYDLNREDKDAVIRTLGVEDGISDEEAYRMNGLYAVAFAKTSQEILGCTSADHSVYMWNYKAGRMLRKLVQHSDEVNGITFHPTQQVMCTCSDDGTAMIWDYQEGSRLRTLEEHEKAVYGATFFDHHSEFNVATCSFDQKVRVFDMRDRSVVQTLQGHTDDVIGLDFSAMTQQLVTGSDDGCICVWDCRQWGLPLFKIDTREDPGIEGNEVKRVSLSLNGGKVACGCSSQQVLVYDISGPSPACIGVLGGHSQCVFDVCWGVDTNGCEFLVDASHDNTSFVWKPRS